MGKIIRINKKINYNNEFKNKVEVEKVNESLTLSDLIFEEDCDEERLSYGNIYEVEKSYYRSSKRESKKISNFIMRLKESIRTNNNTILSCEVETEKYELIQIELNKADFLSSSRFKNTLYESSMNLIFKGKNEDLDDIKGILLKGKYKEITGTSHTGIIKNKDEYVFVDDNGCIDKEGNIIDDIKYIGENKIKSGLSKISSISKEELLEISNKLFNFNDINITSSIIGFCSSCFLRERLYLDNGTKGPHLLICGEAGSGKSQTLENIIMTFFDTNTKMSADQCTRFVNVNFAGSSNTLPFIIEEYKPTTLSKTRRDEISAVLRNGYDRTSGYRGNVEQKLNEYPVLTPIVLMGEMSIEESAGLERSILIYFSKSKSYLAEREANYKYLKRHKQILKKFSRAVLEQALNLDTNTIINRYDYLDEKYSYLPSRVRNSAVTCMLGILLVKDIFEIRGLDFQKCTGYEVDTLLNAIKDNVIESVLGGCTEVKGIIEKNIEVLNDMVETGDLIKGIDYKLINNDTEIALNVKMFYPKLLRYINSRNNKEIEKLSQNEFTKQLRLKEYYKDYKAIRFVYNSEAKNAKAFVLDISKLEEKVCVENFRM